MHKVESLSFLSGQLKKKHQSSSPNKSRIQNAFVLLTLLLPPFTVMWYTYEYVQEFAESVSQGPSHRGTVKWLAINFITFAGPRVHSHCTGLNCCCSCSPVVLTVVVVVVGNTRQLINWKLRLNGRQISTTNKHTHTHTHMTKV